jgi:hypothetical protein
VKQKKRKPKFSPNPNEDPTSSQDEKDDMDDSPTIIVPPPPPLEGLRTQNSRICIAKLYRNAHR